MDATNVYAVLLAAIGGLTGKSAWDYYIKKTSDDREDVTSYKTECKLRIEKLEDMLRIASVEKENMRKTILELSVQLAAMEVKIQILQDYNLKHIDLKNK